MILGHPIPAVFLLLIYNTLEKLWFGSQQFCTSFRRARLSVYLRCIANESAPQLAWDDTVPTGVNKPTNILTANSIIVNVTKQPNLPTLIVILV